jgi:hypothetical protein
MPDAWAGADVFLEGSAFHHEAPASMLQVRCLNRPREAKREERRVHEKR